VSPHRPLPPGAEAWKDSRVRVPDAVAGRTLRHLFTGEEVPVASGGDGSWISAADALNTCPVAILYT
jgi:hypothetical protein